jgi:hypothetical protein
VSDPGFGLGQRLSFYPGDFFKDSLPSTEVIIMGHILHNWGLEEKRQLIAKAHAALPKGGCSSSAKRLLMINGDKTRLACS